MKGCVQGRQRHSEDWWPACYLDRLHFVQTLYGRQWTCLQQLGSWSWPLQRTQRRLSGQVATGMIWPFQQIIFMVAIVKWPIDQCSISLHSLVLRHLVSPCSRAGENDQCSSISHSNSSFIPKFYTLALQVLSCNFWISFEDSFAITSQLADAIQRLHGRNHISQFAKCLTSTQLAHQACPWRLISLQAETYRRMRKLNRKDWQSFTPATNVLWIYYIVDIILQRKQCKLETSQKNKLRNFRSAFCQELRSARLLTCSTMLQEPVKWSVLCATVNMQILLHKDRSNMLLTTRGPINLSSSWGQEKLHLLSDLLVFCCRKRCLRSKSCAELVTDEIFKGAWQTCSGDWKITVMKIIKLWAQPGLLCCPIVQILPFVHHGTLIWQRGHSSPALCSFQIGIIPEATHHMSCGGLCRIPDCQLAREHELILQCVANYVLCILFDAVSQSR